MRHYCQEELAAKVKALNTVNKVANEIEDQLRWFFSGQIGRKVVKADGSLTARIKETLPRFDTGKVQVFKQSGQLAWTVKTSEQVTNITCTYAEVTVHVGILDGGVLTGLQTTVTRSTDLTVEEVNALVEHFKVCEKALEDAAGALYATGLY